MVAQRIVKLDFHAKYTAVYDATIEYGRIFKRVRILNLSIQIEYNVRMSRFEGGEKGGEGLLAPKCSRFACTDAGPE